MDHEGRIFFLAHHFVQEGGTGIAFIRQGHERAHAGVDEQSQLERQVSLSREVFDSLWTAVLLEREVIFREAVDDLPMLVANGCEQIHYLYFSRIARSRGLRAIR